MATHPPSRIELRGISFSVDGVKLLNIPQLAFARDGKTVILGRNGAGKSLLLKLINGILQPDTGAVFIDDLHLSDPKTPKQAFVFQSPVLLRRTTRANLEFATRLSQRKGAQISRLLEISALTHKAALPARRLSGGESQRLAVAMALATEPDILLLDEPTASLDPTSTKVIEEIIEFVAARGVKVILVTHDIAQAKRLADEVVVFSDGSVKAQSQSSHFFSAQASEAARSYPEGPILK